jgi:hypothetical protein
MELSDKLIQSIEWTPEEDNYIRPKIQNKYVHKTNMFCYKIIRYLCCMR